MDIAFIMGMVFGFILGIGFCLFFTTMLARQFLRVMTKKKPEEEELFDDDPVNFWKPKGWRPDKFDH